jgi:hypothetical protein
LQVAIARFVGRVCRSIGQNDWLGESETLDLDEVDFVVDVGRISIATRSLEAIGEGKRVVAAQAKSIAGDQRSERKSCGEAEDTAKLEAFGDLLDELKSDRPRKR